MKKLVLTSGFPQMWLDGSTIDSYVQLSSGSGGTSNFQL